MIFHRTMLYIKLIFFIQLILIISEGVNTFTSKDDNSTLVHFRNSFAVTQNDCGTIYREIIGTIVVQFPDNLTTSCDWYVIGPTHSLVSMTISTESTGNRELRAVLTIEDVLPGEVENSLLFSYSTAQEIAANSLSIYSFTPRIHIILNASTENTTVPTDPLVNISYAILTQDDLTVVMESSSGVIASDGELAPMDTINYQKNWLICSTQNFIHFNFANMSLDDSAGDFLAIGSGNETFDAAPASVITNVWPNYPTIGVANHMAYVHLFVKNYTSQSTFALIFDETEYHPPTAPSPTASPPDVLNCTIYFDDSTDDYIKVMTQFVNVMVKYALEYCNSDSLDINITVTEVVEIPPCLVIVFDFQMSNGTCHGSTSFSALDYQYMMGNYSKEMDDDFGRDILSSCPDGIKAWVLGIVLLAIVSLTIIICLWYCVRRRQYKKMRPERSRTVGQLEKNGSGCENPAFTGSKENIYINTDCMTSTCGISSGTFVNQESFLPTNINDGQHKLRWSTSPCDKNYKTESLKAVKREAQNGILDEAQGSRNRNTHKNSATQNYQPVVKFGHAVEVGSAQQATGNPCYANEQELKAFTPASLKHSNQETRL